MENGSMKIVTGGRWSMTIEELGSNYHPIAKSNYVDSSAIAVIKDSLLMQRMNFDAKIDTLKNYPELEEETKEWRLIDSRKGYGQFETEWFSLPKCKIKIIAAAMPFDISFHGGISLEGKKKSESWDVIPSAWHMTRSPVRGEKIFNIPAGKYFFCVDVDEASWEYKIYTYY